MSSSLSAEGINWLARLARSRSEDMAASSADSLEGVLRITVCSFVSIASCSCLCFKGFLERELYIAFCLSFEKPDKFGERPRFLGSSKCDIAMFFWET
jgi:hypothetical protein